MAYCVHCGEQVADEGTFCPKCGKPKAVTGAGGGTAVVAVQKAEVEKTFLSTQAATVTNTRIIVPGKTYAMAGITSVRSETVSAKRGWAICTALIGLCLLAAREPGWGIILLIVGVLWAFALKDSYAVAVNSASGEIHAVVSKDQKYISKIVQAVNQAIVYRN
jgi:hypothetical protein